MNNFDSEKHEYSIDGVVVPSVTTIVKECLDLYFPDTLIMEIKRELGVQIHKELHSQIVVEKKPASHGANEIFKFLEEKKLEILDEISEKPMFSKRFNFGGTADLIAENDKELYICDYKTGIFNRKYCELQLAGYSQLIDEYFDEKQIKKNKLKKYIVFNIRDNEVKIIKLQVDQSHVGKFILAVMQRKNNFDAFAI